MIDYLNNMRIDNPNRLEGISQVVRDLKDMAGELNTPIALVCQLNRDNKMRRDKRPILEDLRETGEIEQQADLVAMLYREEYYDPNSVERGIAEVLIRKQRQGPTGTIRLLFESACTRFRNLSKLGMKTD